MSSIVGPAPIVDFDGTVADLDVDWGALRARLGIERIGDLWDVETADWVQVTSAEEHGASTAVANDPLIAILESTQAIAFLTNNAESAVRRFLRHRARIADRVTIVVGRETLAGPKSDFEVFSAGFGRCVEATTHARGDGPVVYVGDMDYELEYAERLGAVSLHVRDVAARA